MDELILKSLRGEATDIEVRHLDHWRAESSENDREYRAFINLWNGTWEPNAPTISPAPALDGIVREGDARRALRQTRATRRAVLRSPWVAYGLTTAAMAALIFMILPLDKEQDSSTHGLFPVESSSSPGDITTLGLSDGSVVRTMPGTRLEFPATVDRREVMLEGRAFFAVAADLIPFVVRTRIGEVTVHGTRFEVITKRDELRLVVVEGRVGLKGESGVVEVGPGQVAHLQSGSSPRVVDYSDVWSTLGWADGLLIYEATPLSLVAEELSRHFGRKVTILDEAFDQIRITAWFEDESIEEVVSAVCLVAGARCEVSEAEVTIGR
jgi:ferric-dicitrate binding protein FerR (iron transport regulator)